MCLQKREKYLVILQGRGGGGDTFSNSRVEGVTIRMQEGVSMEIKEEGWILDALEKVPFDLKKESLVTIYHAYPDDRSETYEGRGALGRCQPMTNFYHIQIFPAGTESQATFSYTLGHEFAEAALLKRGNSLVGYEKEKAVDRLAKTWGFVLPS